MTSILLHAPLAGWLAPLEEVPDPVFAQRMMGDGVAIDPLEGVLRAPCDAVVIAVPDSRHAVTLALANGAELLIHIGLETVALAGEGFTAHVAAGQQVRTGDPLLSFDLDAVARRARSLISPIVVTGENDEIIAGQVNRAVAAGDPIAEVRGGGRTQPHRESCGEAIARDVMIGAAMGIHARPAARIAEAARGFAAVIEIEAEAKRANARSPVALMTLGLRQGDRARLIARGGDAAAAVAALASLIEIGLEEEHEPAPLALAAAPARPPRPGVLQGICASPGLAVGPAAHFAMDEISVCEEGRGVETERQALAAARRAVSARLASAAPSGGGIAAAHRALLDDPELVAAGLAEIVAGRSAGFAWRTAVKASSARLRATGNALLIERIDDLEDIERQVLAELAGVRQLTPRHFPEGAVLLAATLLPSQLLTLDLKKVGGICTALGGPTSHAAILAGAAGVPMLVAAGEELAAVGEGTAVILDAGAGWIETAPDARALAAARERVQEQRRGRVAAAAAALEECRMADGTRIEVFANLGSAEEARQAVAAGAEGCGLLRTEFLFHDRPFPPSEDEQAAVYGEVARALGGRPIIIRTLDAGGDKPLPYLGMAAEENPALGLRGIRIGLSRPEILAAQLRAIIRARGEGDVRIMVPMVVDVDEVRAVRRALDEAAAALGAATVPLGIMVETPAAALLADGLAAEAEFLSVGTNDLTQYALAADRGNPATAAMIDALHPAVLRLIAAAADGARGHGKLLGICGGVASDPLAAAILIGLGATELSAALAAIPALKAAVRQLHMAECRALAARALRAGTARDVRILAAEALVPSLRGAA